jgi:hypothetical protein
MRRGKLVRVSAAMIGMAVGFAGVGFGQEGGKSATPCMNVLDRFVGAPELGPGEEAVAPMKASTQPSAAPAELPGKGLAEHPMIYVGEGYNKMFVVNGGKVIWTYQTGKGNEYDDVWMLSNGNVLFTRMAYIEEVTPKKEVVWRYDATMSPEDPSKHTEIHACQPIGLDRVLFIENGLPPKLKIVNIKTKAVEVEHELDYLKPADPKKIHPQFRRVRMLANGDFLVPYLNMGKVVEYDKDFKVVWSFPGEEGIPATQAAGTTKPATGFMLPDGEKFSPWAAIRLKNGNTLITNESGKSQMEVSKEGKVVWELKPEDLPEQWRYLNTQTCTRLANGDTIVCSRGGNGKGPQLVEVTPEKKVVWVLWDWRELGPATAVQVLDDPGVPEEPGESGH